MLTCGKKALLILISINCGLVMALAVGLGYILANKIMNPVHQLIKASQQVTKGSLTPEIGPLSKDEEMRILQNTFKDMVESLKERDRHTGEQRPKIVFFSLKSRPALEGLLRALPMRSIILWAEFSFMQSLLLEEFEEEKDAKVEDLRKIVMEASRCKRNSKEPP